MILWKPISQEPPYDVPLFVDFGSGGYPSGIMLVMKTDWMYWQEDEGRWKGMGSEADKNATRWCTVDEAVDFLASADDKERKEVKK